MISSFRDKLTKIIDNLDSLRDNYVITVEAKKSKEESSKSIWDYLLFNKSVKNKEYQKIENKKTEEKTNEIKTEIEEEIPIEINDTIQKDHNDENILGHYKIKMKMNSQRIIMKKLIVI